MREIKFRAWDKLTPKYWNIENWHFEDEYLDLIEPGVSIADPNSERVWRKFNEVELMQYTGIKDKNGKDIYEGDVVRYTAWHDGKPTGVFQGEVVYSGDLGMASFDIRLDHDGEIGRAVLPALGVEIIGNAFENPELLEEDE